MNKSKLRTIVYIDGFNFYYGLLKKSHYKWLDLSKLFKTILSEENDLIKIKYFTAKVQPTDRDPQVNIRQDTYFRALEICCPEVEIYFGHFLRHKIFAENANPPPNRIEIFKTEEKGSDVNLALHLLNDAWSNVFDCAIIVSNDSDLATALEFVKEQHKKTIGLVTPGAPLRKTSRQLLKYADFIKPIRKWALEKSLLPNKLPNSEIKKPIGW